MRAKKLILGLWLPLLLLLAACGSAAESPAPEATQEVVLEADILPAPSNTAPPAVPTAAPEGSESVETPQDAPATEATASPQPTATEPPPAATSAPEFNGEYEGTYYRGLATAPITMIDYSDFL